MLQSRSKRTPHRRRGAILIVVLALLALFAVIGLSFIYYADSEANVARAYRQAQTQEGGGVALPDGQDAINSFLKTIIYDDSYTGTALLNAARGHSLARAMYGWSGTAGAHSVPFNGIGAFEDATGLPGGVASRKQLVNFGLIGGNVFDPEWNGAPRAPGSPPALGGTQVYVGKNAGYTFPDGNNFYLGAIDPRTGEVLVRSFHRDWIFGQLDPANPNWQASSPQGRYLTLRPRPCDNLDSSGKEVFPYVPQNQDGSYTGDVQNLIGGVGPQRNDSLWMDIGLAPFQWNGKWIKPLVAPLIVELDSRINVNYAGNISSASNAHQSFGGYGPWETNLSKLLPADANTVITSRYGSATNKPQARYMPVTSTRPYSANVGPLPQYSQVNWSMNSATPATFALPTGTSLAGVPTYTNYETNQATDGPFHPSFFNPREWPAAAAGSSPRSFYLSDERRLALRYADRPEAYDLMDIKSVAPTLVGNTPAAMFSRTDPAHPLRMQFTMLSTGLDVPMLAPQTLDYAASVYQMNANGHPYPNGATTPTLPTVPTLGSTATGSSDYDTVKKAWINKLAALSGVDLNRKLTSYAGSTAALTPAAFDSTKPANVTQTNKAWADRHNLARDIFGRLILATGAAANVNSTTGDITLAASATPGTPTFEALRYLAQLAVNIVDFIDEDDISTVFVWNPTSPATGLPVVTAPSDIQQANYQAANVRNSVVFGVEKPRVLLNEAYSEFVTDPNEMMLDPAAMPTPKLPKNPVHVRFAIELVNANVPPYTAGTGPLGTGPVTLFYASGESGSTANINSYQVVVARDDNGTIVQELRKSDNAKGDLPTLANQPKIQLDLNALATATGSMLRQIDANNNQYPAGSPGFVVLAAKVATATDPMNQTVLGPLNADPSTGIAPTQLIQGSPPTGNSAAAETTALTYVDDGAVPTDNDLKAGSAFHQKMQKHVVLLRRLANPYQAANDPDGGTFVSTLPPNPYITVDFLNYVPSMDAVYVSSDTTTKMARKPKDAMTMDGYDPKTPMDPMYQRFSVGRVQPMAGYFASTTAPLVADSSTAQHLLPQKPTNPPPTEVNHTFGRHNGIDGTTYPAAAGTETLAAPFNWFPHFDRPLGTPLELMMVSRCKPHEVTQMFLPQSGANLVAGSAGNHLAHWIEPFNNTAGQPTTGLHRAFELLRVKPWDYYTPLGGKVHGRVNPNGIVDTTNLEAILDKQTSNQFTVGDVTNASTNLLASRSTTVSTVTLPNMSTVSRNTPGQSMYEGVGGSDKPFRSHGTAQFSTGEGLGDTFLRPQSGNTLPQAWVPGLDSNSVAHPYLQSEAARKMWHNTTPVSNAFAMWVTIGFFEVQTDAAGAIRYETGSTTVSPGRPLLGKEVYREVPGDTRQQYFAIVDRTNLTLDPTDATKQGPRPFFTEIVDTAPIGTTSITVPASQDSSSNTVIYADGEAITIANNSTLFLGTGPYPDPLAWGTQREMVTVSSATYNATTGQATLMISPTTKHHPAGTLVTNAVPGNPGPQPNFNYNSTTYTPVVREVTRIK